MDESASESEAFWRKILVEGHRPTLISHRLFRLVPSAPRCKMCHNPFGGLGGKFFAAMGFKPSRKNPTLCSKCCDSLPVGGANVDVAILFADVRGSTSLGEQTPPEEFARRMNRFYAIATEVLVAHDAIVDKLIGDEVMALFLPGVAGPAYRRKAAKAAIALLQAEELPLGAGVNAGVAYVGNVGDRVVDFTALGDVVNAGARLASLAASGELLVSEDVYAEIAGDFPDAPKRSVTVRGKEEAIDVRALQAKRSA